MATPLRVLVVEDSEDDALLLLRELRRGGYELTWERTDTADGMRDALARQAWDVIIADYALPQFNAPSALALLKEAARDIPFIVVSGTIGEESAVAVMKAGAHDYVMKGNLARLNAVIEREVRDAVERTERRQMEAQLRQAQKMEAIGLLAGGIAHDFNNLLTVLGGFGALLRHQTPPTDARRPAVDEILKATDRATALTRQLLAFSREQEFKPEVVDVNALVDDTRGLLRRLIDPGVEIRSQLAPDVGLVRVDRGQLGQIVMNLVVNASDAMPQGGTVTIETANVAVADGAPCPDGLIPAGLYVMLAVQDTGEGMDAATKEHIFDPFYTTKEVGKGTGLGLFTVYGIVKQSSGHITVESEPGEGATFRIYLPREAAAVQGPEAGSAAAPTATTHATVLVVDDDAQARRLMQIVLENAGYTVLEAGDGTEAIRVGEQHSGAIDLLVTDIGMPGMSGHKVVDALREARPDLPAILVTGYVNRSLPEDSVERPVTALLPKPFNIDELVERAEAVLKASR